MNEMNNELICLSVPNFQGNEKKYVDQAVDEEWVSTAGPFIASFEKNMAETMGVPQACACQSGTAGLHLCLRHFGIGENDIVLVPTLTFIAPINAVVYQNATPVFFDCDENLCIDMSEKVAGSIKSLRDAQKREASGAKLDIVGPTEAYIYRINNVFRRVIYIKSEEYDILTKVASLADSVFSEVQQNLELRKDSIEIQYDFNPMHIM